MSSGNYYQSWAYGGTIDQFGGVSQQPTAYPNYASSSSYNSQSQFGPYGQAVGASKSSQILPSGSQYSTPVVGANSINVGNLQQYSLKPEHKLKAENPWQPLGGQPQQEKTITSLDAAVFNAAKNYLSEQRTSSGQKLYGTWRERFRGGKGPPIDPSQWKYCELCKCTCAGDLAYKSHIVGKAHKKKEQASLASMGKGGGAQGGGHYYCELCEVSCSSYDAYAAHIRGIRHQKIMKVQMRMGKPVPEHLKSAEAAVAMLTGSGMAGMPSGNQGKKIVRTQEKGNTKIISTSKMTFVGGNRLHSTEGMDDDGGVKKVITYGGSVCKVEEPDEFDEAAQIIGELYLVEKLNESGTAYQYYCKLCDCSLSDRYAKMCHAKGKKHRLQYKKKVDPSLKVDPPAPVKFNRNQPWRRKDAQESLRAEAEMLRYEKEMLEWQLGKSSGCEYYPGVSLYVGVVNNMGSTNTNSDNQHITSKHGDIYPSEEDLGNVRDIVLAIEKALKLLSDKSAVEGKERELKGVMRVKNLANGLLLKGDLVLDFVVLTNTRPTKAMLLGVAKDLPKELGGMRDDKWNIEIVGEGLRMKSEKFPDILCTIKLTSPSMAPSQEGDEGSEGDMGGGSAEEEKETPDHLSKEGCLQTLALLRRAKWFQVKISGSPAWMIVVRVLMDFCKRVPTWTPLGQWALELLVEKVLSSEPKIPPATAMRFVFEAVASGLFLPDSPGLIDPCEKDPTDATSHLKEQEREDITNSAQHALRMFTFGLVYRILGLPKKLPPPSLVPGMSKKRPRND